MRAIGFVLLISGWLLLLAALVLLPPHWQRGLFVGAGCAVEVLGLALAGQSYRAEQMRRRDETWG